MKKILVAAALVASSMSVFAQSNTKGTIHLGLGYGALLGGATLKVTPEKGDASSLKGVGVRGTTGLRVGYGLADAFSLGIYLRKEGAAYAVSGTQTYGNYSYSYSYGVVQSQFGFGLEPKVYAVNKDKFNLYFGLPIGMSTGSVTYTGDLSGTSSDKSSGLSYGLNVGFNWYWASFIGMSMDLGYNGIAHNIKPSDSNDKNKYALSGNGVYIGFGLVSKFGGK